MNTMTSNDGLIQSVNQYATDVRATTAPANPIAPSLIRLRLVRYHWEGPNVSRTQIGIIIYMLPMSVKRFYDQNSLPFFKLAAFGMYWTVACRCSGLPFFFAAWQNDRDRFAPCALRTVFALDARASNLPFRSSCRPVALNIVDAAQFVSSVRAINDL